MLDYFLVQVNWNLVYRNALLSFLVWITTGPVFAKTEAIPKFPLKFSASGRYLIDQNEKPFLIKEISAWGLIQSLSEPDESAFIDSVRKKGFNTLMVSIISFDTRFAGNPPDWQSNPPFTIKWDFSTYNPAYFEHVDRFLHTAAREGMLVLLVPCYLGYKGDGNQGWWDELLNPKNDQTKSFRYGQYLGNRYRDFQNIIWVAGGDNDGRDSLFGHMTNIIKGIKEFDKGHLWTGHFSSIWATRNQLYASYIDIDALYDFTESALQGDTPQYRTTLNQYALGKMIFQIDQSYEHDIPHSADNENPQWIRRKNYDGFLSGCSGTSFCPGMPGNPCYTFIRWRPLMNTEGMREMLYCFNVFDSRPWHLLIPDTGKSTIIKGRGTYRSLDYVCAARAKDSSFYMAYLPVGRTLSVDMRQIGGTQVRVWWYDPQKGEATLIGLFPAAGVKHFSTPDKRDWLLVIDNASLDLPAPGTHSG
jgi:hypothetical protein